MYNVQCTVRCTYIHHSLIVLCLQGSGIPQYKSHDGLWRRMTEPPVTAISWSTTDLKNLSEPLRTGHPCHSQLVERMVKITSDVVEVVSGHQRQVGEALAKLKGRKEIPRRVVRRDILGHLVPTK